LSGLGISVGAIGRTCILVFAKESEAILSILKKLTEDSPNAEQVSATLIRKIETPFEPTDPWLHHNEAAEYLGISKSTLYRYAEHGHIESRKLGNRLEYRRSALDQFKNQKVRPARRSSHGRGISRRRLSPAIERSASGTLSETWFALLVDELHNERRAVFRVSQNNQQGTR